MTPSTIFDFMNGKINAPNSKTIKKLFIGAEITLKDFLIETILTQVMIYIKKGYKFCNLFLLY